MDIVQTLEVGLYFSVGSVAYILIPSINESGELIFELAKGNITQINITHTGTTNVLYDFTPSQYYSGGEFVDYDEEYSNPGTQTFNVYQLEKVVFDVEGDAIDKLDEFIELFDFNPPAS